MNRPERQARTFPADPISGLVTSLCVVAAMATACKRDPAEVEGERMASDKTQLTDAVMRDVVLDGILRKADAFAQAGDEDKAVATVTNEAIAAADRAVAAADAIRATSAWGADRVEELKNLAHARRDALPAYVNALQGEDLEAKLNATLTQVKLEQQAMTVLAHVNGDANVSHEANASSAAATLTARAPDAHL